MTETRQLSRQILVRLSPELATAIDANASARGITSAAWLRQLAADAVTGNVVTPRDRQRSPRRRPAPVISGDEAEVRALVRQLGIVGGAVVQLAKGLREGERPEHPAAEEVLRELRATSEAARQLVRRFA